MSREDIKRPGESEERSGEPARLMDLLRGIVEVSPVGVIACDLNGAIIMTNSAAKELFGGAVTGTAYGPHGRYSLLLPDGSPFPPHELPLPRAVDKGETVKDIEILVRWEDGTERCILASGNPVCNSAGQTVAGITFFQDITERKEAERERERLLEQMREMNRKLAITSAQSEKRAEEAERRRSELDSVLDAMEDGLAIYDSQGNTVRMNPAIKRILGLSEEELRLPAKERASLLRYEKLDGTPYQREELPTIRSLHGETVYEQIMVAHRPGRTVWFSVNSVPIRSESGQIIGSVATVTDVTERIRSERFREEYISLISHDLRNPLAVVMSGADWLTRLLKQRANMQYEAENAEAILRNAQRMNAMIQDLVDTTRLESGRMEMHKEKIDLLPFTVDIVEHMGTIQERERIQVEAPNWVPPVLADPERIERVVTNLIGNALKFSASDAPVVVRVARTDGQTLVSVSDQGVGIAPDELPHLFERFYRARATEDTEGLGLGLYISRLIIEAHGGRIWAESELGEGSTFHFTLPVV